MRHIMFINQAAHTDPTAVACGLDMAEQHIPHRAQHANYYCPSFYRAPFSFVLDDNETVIVHFNAPPSVRWLNGDNQLDRFTDKDLTLSVTNQTREPFEVAKETLLERLIEQNGIISEFRLTSRVYRHQIVMDTYNDDDDEGPDNDRHDGPTTTTD